MKTLKPLFLIASFILITVFSARATPMNLKFAVISDAHVVTLDTALEFILSQDVDFIILAGDFYNGQQDYYPHFTKYGFSIDPQLSGDRQPIYFVMGNHDEAPEGEPGFQTLIAPYYPTNGPSGAPTGTIFSFDRGKCHFVITNQYWQYPEGGYTKQQLDWIEQDLSRSSMPFKFVVGHEPAFPLERHIGNSLDIDPGMRDKFWKLLSHHNVQAFFSGHSHNLSHMIKDDVYQFDAGQISADHVCVTIVEVDDKKAVVSSFENAEDYSLVATAEEAGIAAGFFYRTLVPQNPDNVSLKTILFEGNSSKNGGFCFIDTLCFP